MPPTPEARAKRLHQRDADGGVGMRFLARQNVEGEGEKAVAGEDRGRFVEFAMRGRLAAAQFVIVHGRQIVMDQRIAMHAFKRRARHQGAFCRGTPNRAADSTTRNGRNRLPPPRLE